MKITSYCRVLTIFALVACSPSSSFAQGISAEILAWEKFCEQLKRSGSSLLLNNQQGHEIDRAQGLSYLTQRLARSVGDVMAKRDKGFPLLRLGTTHIEKAGLDGADAKYITADIDGRGIYRLSGTLGSARIIAIQLAKMNPVYEAYASLSGTDMVSGEDNKVDILIAENKPKDWQGVWLPMNPDSTTLWIREYFGDWQSEQSSDFVLQRMDVVDSDMHSSVEHSTEMLNQVAEHFKNQTQMWISSAEFARENLANKLSQGLTNPGQGLVNNIYGIGWFNIVPEQALLIELEEPEAKLWSFQLADYWWQSLDYVNRTASINGDQAVVSSDGKYRLVIARQDPGVPNWLDPGDHPEGMIMYRYQDSTSAPEPVMKLIKLENLMGILPADTKKITLEQRRQNIDQRRLHAHRRWSP